IQTVREHLTQPRLCGDILVSAGPDGVRGSPWRALLGASADEARLRLVEARALAALGRATEAIAEVDALLEQAPPLAPAWELKAAVHEGRWTRGGVAESERREEMGRHIAARCRAMELSGREESPDLRARFGLVRRLSAGGEVTADLQMVDGVVYVGTRAGVLL